MSSMKRKDSCPPQSDRTSRSKRSKTLTPDTIGSETDQLASATDDLSTPLPETKNLQPTAHVSLPADDTSDPTIPNPDSERTIMVTVHSTTVHSERPPQDSATVPRTSASTDDDSNPLGSPFHAPSDNQQAGREVQTERQGTISISGTSARSMSPTGPVSSPSIYDNAGRVAGPFHGEIAEDAQWGYDDGLNRRISTFMSWSDPKNSTYYIANIPRQSDLEWGTKSDRDFTEYLFETAAHRQRVQPGNSRRLPVTLWIVGKISGLFLFTASGTPERQANIIFRPLRVGDLRAAKDLVQRYTYDKFFQPFGGSDVIRAGKWMTKRVPGTPAETVEPFTAIYDATTVFQAKSKMDQFRPESLKRNDLALFEVQVSRFRDRLVTDDFTSPTKSAGRGNRGSSKKPDIKWRATLVLKAVNVLHSSDTIDDEDSADDGENSEDDNLAI